LGSDAFRVQLNEIGVLRFFTDKAEPVESKISRVIGGESMGESLLAEWGLDVHWIMEAARPVPRDPRGGRDKLVEPNCKAAVPESFMAFIFMEKAVLLTENSPPDCCIAANPTDFKESLI
jgi:hypothetical protein